MNIELSFSQSSTIKSATLKRASGLFCFALFSALFLPQALAADTWTTPHPGMRQLYRTASGPNKIHALEVDLCRAGVGVRATKPNERERTTSSFGSLVGAQAAINGDFFSFNTYNVSGLAIGDGQVWPERNDARKNSYVAFGKHRVEFSGADEVRPDERWMRQVTSGKGVLMEDGVKMSSPPSDPEHCAVRHPRTAMGISRDKKTLYLVVVDGRSSASVGMTCVELANVMKGLGAWDAVNLDGGGSSTMWVQGKGVVNNFSDATQRVVGNHFAVYAKGSGEPGYCDRSVEEAAVYAGGRGLSTTTDVDGDGLADACSLGPEGLECFLAADNFNTRVQGPAMPYDRGWHNEKNFSTIRFGDINGDGKADVCARYNEGVRCYLSDGQSFGSRIDGPEWSDDKSWGNSPSYYGTLGMADINGDGKDDLCARASAGLYCYPSQGDSFGRRSDALAALSNEEGFNEPEYYGTIRFGDVNGDGLDDVCARTKDGMRCWLSDGENFTTKIKGPNWSDSGRWNKLPYWSTIRLVDVDGDGKADLCARGSSGFRCHLSTGDGFGSAIGGDQWPDDSGWDDHDNFSTIRMADIDGDGKLDVCARANARVVCRLFQGDRFGPSINGPEWSDEEGWDAPMHYTTIRMADIDGDGKADICARGYSRYSCELAPFDGSGSIEGPEWSVARGWDDPAFYSTIQMVDPPASPEEPEEPGEPEDPKDPGEPEDPETDAGSAPDAGGSDASSGGEPPGGPDSAGDDAAGGDIQQPDPGIDAGDGQGSGAGARELEGSAGCGCSQGDSTPGGASLLILFAGVGVWGRRRMRPAHRV